MKVVLATALMLGMIAAGFAGPAHAAGESDQMILPGVGIGPVRVGMPLAEVITLWGRPTVSHVSETVTMYCWCQGQTRLDAFDVTTGGVFVMTDRNGPVAAVGTLFNGSYLTPEGIQTSSISPAGFTPGSTDTDVRRAFGSPATVKSFSRPGDPIPHVQWDYPNRGITVYMDQYSSVAPLRVYQILVYAPEGAGL
jgi:hypothetical protein